jgi:tetratricopeptide (TPR) repeat protein
MLNLGRLLLACALALAGCSETRKTRHLVAADHYFAAGEYEKAKIEYMNVLRFSFKEPQAIERLGLIWLAEGEPLRAYPYLTQARELVPDDLTTRAKLAALLSSLGELAQARQEALDILRSAPGNEEALLVLADTVRSNADVAETQGQLRKTPDQNDLAYHLAWATLASRTGDLPYVKSELEQALAVDPRSVRAHLMTAALYSVEGDPAQAEREFRTAVGFSPPGSEASLQYAQFKKERGALDEARAILTETLKFAPYFQAARVLLAQIALDQGKLDESMALLETVVNVDYANIDAIILEAQVWLRKGETKRAAEKMELLDVAYPNVPLIKYQLGNAYAKNNQVGQAIIALDQAISGKPDYIDAVLLRADLQLRGGNPSLVVPAMLRLLQKQPGLRPAQLLLAEAYRTWGRLDDAAAIMRDQITDSPRSAESYLRLGIILAQQEKTDEARKAFDSAIDLAPEDLTALDRLVDLDISVDHFAEAMQRVKRQLARTPQSARAHFAAGRILAAEDDWNAAEPALLKATELDPNLSSAYELLVFGYVAAGKTSEAIRQLQTILARTPNDQRSLMTLALIYEKQQDFQKARDVYEKILSINPRFTAALNNLAILYTDVFNAPAKGYELARQARLAEPSRPAFADTLGWALFQQGDYQAALSFIVESARALTNDPKVQFHLGRASYMMGQVDQAHAAFQNAAGMPVDSTSKREAGRWLAYLQDDSGAAPQLSVAELEQLVQQRPNDVIARMRLGGAFEKQGHPQKAALEYQAAVNVNPKLSEAILKLARLYCGPLHDSAKALELAKMAREIEGATPRVSSVLGKAALQTANCTWAYNLLHEAARQLPKDSQVLADFAWSAYSLGKVSEARQVMQRAAKESTSQPFLNEARLFLFMTALNPEDVELALESQIESTLKGDPDYVPALMAEAAIQVERGETQSAIETCSRILRRFPDFAPAQKELASIYLDDPSRTSEAYDLALKAHNAFPDDERLSQVLGELSYRRNEFAYAVQLLEHSNQSKETDPNLLFYLGMSHFRLEHVAEGRKALKRSLARGLKEPLASEARRVLGILSKPTG